MPQIPDDPRPAGVRRLSNDRLRALYADALAAVPIGNAVSVDAGDLSLALDELRERRAADGPALSAALSAILGKGAAL